MAHIMPAEPAQRRHNRLIGFDPRPGGYSLVYAAIPFVLLIGAYMAGSAWRLAQNGRDKLMPAPTTMFEAFWQALAVYDRQTDSYLLLSDWTASMERLGAGLGLAAGIGLILGLNLGLYRGLKTLIGPFVTFAAIVPPLVMLPILFVTMGTGETGKISLIFLGCVWSITRDIERQITALGQNQVIKALTLGASPLALTYQIMLPQALPRLLSAVRANLGPAWLFLIAAESIASESGLGYRIFLVRRYTDMALIIPYALIITATGYGLDWLLRKLTEKLWPWYVATLGDG